MEAQLAKLLPGLFPALDEAQVEYFAGVAVEATPKNWKSGKDAFDAIGEMLESYEAVANEKEAKAKCDELFKLMQEQGLVKTAAAPAPKPAAAASAAPSASAAPASSAKPAAAATPAPAAAAAASKPAATSSSSSTTAATPSASSSSSTPTVAPQPGYTCMARFSGDGLFYKALVLSVKTIPVVRVRVRFTAYGDEEEVPLTALKDVVVGVMPVETKGKRAVREAGDNFDEDDDDEDDDDDDDEDDDEEEPTVGKKLLSNPVRIGEVAKSAAALRLEEREVARVEAEKHLTPKELKLLRKRQAKAQKAAAETEKKRTWVPDEHRRAIVNTALPIYLQSQHLAKKAGTKDIALEDLCLLAPDNTELLVNTELKLVFGRKYGLVGRNGIGKSTLLRQIATYQLPKFPTWIKIMHVEQECIPENISVLQVVLNADLERGLLLKEEAALNAALKKLEAAGGAAAAEVTEPPSPTSSTTSTATSASSKSAASAASAASSSEAPAAAEFTIPSTAAELSDRLTTVYERLMELDSSTATARAGTILNGLQFTQEMQQMPTKALSGGWKMRVELARALFVSPDLLLLDEPTNHLDLPAVLWLQQYLIDYPKTVLIVSHDRTFLNNVITDVIHFTNKKRLEYYRGDFTNFLRVKDEKYKADKRAYESQQMHRQHLQDFITTFKTEKKSAAQDRKVGQAMSKQKVLDKMELLENPDAESSDKFSLKFPEPGQLRLPLIADIKDLSFRYPKRAVGGEGDTVEDPKLEEERRLKRLNGTLSNVITGASSDQAANTSNYLLSHITIRVEITSRIGIIGANGCGKSTLVKVLLGELQPVEGLVWLNPNVRVAYFTQHHVDQLNPGLSAVQWLKELFPGTLEVECRRHLGKFGLFGDLVLMQIGNLSGGQKSRLAFAIICWKEPHMLILDEPTNHLDLDTQDVLIKAINEFKGPVLIISHDQHFLDATCKEFWSISNSKLSVFQSFAACKKATYAHLEA